MRIVHLLASPFFGGPERQVLGLARHCPREVESLFVSFAERGLSRMFLDEVHRCGFQGSALVHNTPRYFACVREVASELRRLKADLICCSGYKPDLVGWRAARQVGIPVVSISHGWTSATWRVRCYEHLDRVALRWMDATICVSKAQAAKARNAKVSEAKIVVIQNSIGEEAFVAPVPDNREEMAGWFGQPPRWLIGAAGRLSPEKGYSLLVEAAAIVVRQRPEAGFVLFGDGPLRGDLERLIESRGLRSNFVLAGFRNDLSMHLASLDVHVMSSYTEGLPVILLEASAAGVPTVATSVGGIPEVVADDTSGYLVPPGDPAALADRVILLIDNAERRLAFGQAARDRVRREFSFSTMSQRYCEVFRKLVGSERA